jgi:hypothetical protein
MNQKGFCIFIHTVCEGAVPLVREGDHVSVFATRREAELEIVDNLQTRLQQFIDNERDFDDAITVEEYIVEVDALPDGSVVSEEGEVFQ